MRVLCSVLKYFQRKILIEIISGSLIECTFLYFSNIICQNEERLLNYWSVRVRIYLKFLRVDDYFFSGYCIEQSFSSTA